MDPGSVCDRGCTAIHQVLNAPAPFLELRRPRPRLSARTAALSGAQRGRSWDSPLWVIVGRSLDSPVWVTAGEELTQPCLSQ